MGHVLLRVCFLFMIAVVRPVSAEPTSRPTDSAVVATGEAEGGLRASIEMSDTRVALGNKVVVEFVLENVGADEILVGYSQDLFYEVHIDLRTDGKAVSLTEDGRQQKSLASKASSVLGTLKPDERWRTEVDLSRLFDLSMPAKYELQVTRNFQHRKSVTSGVLKFEVVGKPTTDRSQNPQIGAPAKGVVAQGKLAGGLRLVAGISQSKVETGTPVIVKVTLTNETDAVIRVPALREFDTVFFDILRPNGEQVPLTPRGRRFAVVAELRGQILGTLEPAASVAHTVRLDELYDLSRHGKYRVVARIPVSTDVTVESGSLEFDVTDVGTTTRPTNEN